MSASAAICPAEFPVDCTFLELRADKAPISWDPIDATRIDALQHVGVTVPEPFVVIDIDDPVQAEKCTRLLLTKKIKCRIAKTTRGIHVWFRCGEKLRNLVGASTPVGIKVDYRSWGKKSQLVIKLNGQMRVWLNDVPFEEIGELPWWLKPLPHGNQFWTMGEGDGRNDALFRYQSVLAHNGKSHSQAVEVSSLINDFIFMKPLSEDELNSVCRPEAYPEKKQSTVAENATSDLTPWFSDEEEDRRTFLHNVMGDRLSEEMNIVNYRGRLYIFRDGYYQLGENDVLKRLISLFPESKIAQRNEVLKYLSIQCQKDEVDIDAKSINVKNGRLNLVSFDLEPHSPEHFDTQQINAVFDPRAFDPILDAMLWKVFCGKPGLYQLFEEVVGYCLIRNCFLQIMIILLGDGSNGKSAVLRILKHFLGNDNVSTVSLHGLEDRFKTAELENKLANIGDDIPSMIIKDSSTLKNLSSGDPITVERKNKDPFVLKNYAKLFFSANKMPRIDDQSHGLARRICIFPCEATISNSDPDYDPMIIDKITTERAMSYMLNIGIRGIQRLNRCGKVTLPDEVARAVEVYRSENSSILTWIDDEAKTADSFKEQATRTMYAEYKRYCEDNGLVAKAKRGFSNEVLRKFDLVLSESRRFGQNVDRAFLVKPCVTNKSTQSIDKVC